MSKLRIFIEGKELDTLESVTVPITKQFEELSNPTVICNDYSKTVTVPLSANNNAIFGHCYNPDRLIVAGGDNTPLTGVYFDPYKKLDCRLQWGDDVFFTGYAKMLKVTNKGYEVTINGELGKIFQELKKISFQKSNFESDEEIEKYWIDGSQYVNTAINKSLVYKCWNSQQTDFSLKKTTDSGYDVSQILGFLANNSYSNDFDYSTIELSDGTTQSIDDYLGEAFETNTGYSRESVIGDGIMPAAMCQFRSYEQIPFIYWNKFWQIFQAKAEALTGYSWDYSDWGTNNNKNFAGLGITLLQRDSMQAVSEKVVDESLSIAMNGVKFNSYVYNSGNTITPSAYGSTLVSGGVLQVNDGEMRIKLNTSLTISIYNSLSTAASLIKFYQTSSLKCGLRVRYMYGDHTLLDYLYGMTADESVLKSKSPTSTFIGVVRKTVTIEQEAWGNWELGNGTQYITIPKSWGNNKITVILSSIVAGTDTSLISIFSLDGDPVYTYNQVKATATLASGPDVQWTKTNFRSDDEFTLNDLCTLNFDNILDYCKRFRLNIYVDELNKKLVFTRKYFASYSVKDMTDRVDASTFDIETTTFDKKYVLFSYAESETLLGSEYKSLVGYPYGAKRLDTGYNFGTESTTLFEKSKESIIYSPTLMPWMNLQFSMKSKNFFYYVLLNNRFLECRDEDGKTKDVSGSYFYPVKKVVDYNKTAALLFWITDDSKNQKAVDTYCGYESIAGTPSYYVTSPELVLEDTLVLPTQYFTCLFEKPVKNYTAKKNYYTNASGVYATFWKKYINERYNKQNKKVTTYVRLSPSDYINFKFNQFWKIGNQVYIVNKIFDYDITSEKPTKVELITVQDISAYS